MLLRLASFVLLSALLLLSSACGSSTAAAPASTSVYPTEIGGLESTPEVQGMRSEWWLNDNGMHMALGYAPLYAVVVPE